MHLAAELVQLLRNGEGYRAAHASAYYAHLFEAVGLGGAAEGAAEVGEAFAHFLLVKLHGGCAHYLEDDLNGARLPVVARHGERDALTVLVDAQYYKLPGLSLFGNERRIDIHHRDRGIQYALCFYFVHVHNSLVVTTSFTYLMRYMGYGAL